MQKHFMFIISFALFAGVTFSQELLINGTFDDGLEGWTHWDTMDGSFTGTADIGDDDGGPRNSTPPYLYMRCEGNGYFNQAIWQPITVSVGDTIMVDGQFVDLTGGELHNYWCEITIGSIEPTEGQDYTHNNLLAFNTWTGCGPNADGTFQELACVNNIPDGYWVVPDSMGTGEFTAYFFVKTGVWTDGSEGTLYYEIGIDSLSAFKINGNTTGVNKNKPASPTAFALEQNYPNPFNPSTTIRYTLPQASLVELTIYDIQGKQIQTLTSQMMSAGEHAITWNAQNAQGQPVPSGIYVYKLQTDLYSATNRMLLLK